MSDLIFLNINKIHISIVALDDKDINSFSFISIVLKASFPCESKIASTT